MTNYFLGLDLGQAADSSALAVVERSMASHLDGKPSRAWQYGCRGLKRWPLGTSYPAIVDYVAKVVKKAPFRQDRKSVG